MAYGRIPEEVIQAVLKHHDIVDIVGKYVHLTKQGHYMKGLCPFHSEKTPSFTVTPEKQIYHCYGCQAGGNVIGFLMEIEGYTFVEAVRALAEEAGMPVTWEAASEEKTQQQKDAAVMIDAHELAAKWYHHVLLNTEQGKPALDYLRSRGVGDRMIEQFQLGYAPPMRDKLSQFLTSRKFPSELVERGGLVAVREGSGQMDRFRDRVMFPLHNHRGQAIAFAGRSLGDMQPKYLNSPETPLFNKSRQLFNLHRARADIRKSGQAVMMEGFMDVIKVWEAGVQNAVATMGTALTEEHAHTLKRMANTVTVCYDGDDAGQSAAFKSIPILEKAGLHVKVAVIPDRLDPDEYIRSRGGERFVREVLDDALPSLKFKLVYIRRNFNLKDVDEKLRYLDTAVKMIAELTLPIEREHYLKELVAEFPQYADSLRQQLNMSRQDVLKKQQTGDNNENLWNNGIGIDPRNGSAPAPVLHPAYHNAEVRLLAAMMHDREIADYVSRKLGDRFNIETHAALAAYLYAYYSQGNEADVSRYLASLQDEKLERLASSIAVKESIHAINPEVIDDYIRQILKVPHQNAIRDKKQEMVRAERAGDVLRAAQMASEIILLEKQLKSLQVLPLEEI
ncbi:DNA primase [Paenibacillus sp. J31TS4]|uniref:DNA primase n=1 Tax=Paenibacillus sp. J31TS4 TaxID=2807195 RepID=UPI001B06076B|nr:DNA primase [Paenibacillus sp. J31TS4]GIP39624.1 DNA primase [Paenibacillus sp. J31TS4]